MVDALAYAVWRFWLVARILRYLFKSLRYLYKNRVQREWYFLLYDFLEFGSAGGDIW